MYNSIIMNKENYVKVKKSQGSILLNKKDALINICSKSIRQWIKLV